MHTDNDFYQLDMFPPVLATRKVGANCHITFEGAHYSVPHDFFNTMVVVRASRALIDILDGNGNCVASHKRSHLKHSYSTVPSHMPPAHLSLLGIHCYDGAVLIKWANNIGGNVSRCIQALLSKKSIEEHAYKSCMAILQLAKKYGSLRLNDACAQALSDGRVSLYAIRKLIVKGNP